MKPLQLYNTLTRSKEDFIPLLADPANKKDKVGLYSCGPTVYSTPHIGNFRATFTADLIRNTLKYLGYPVISVMNITDVGHLVSDADDGEDKLEKGARLESSSAWDIAKKYEELFLSDIAELNIDRFDVMPRATDHIAEQIALVQTLENKGYTYTIEGDGIYMDTSKISDYGKLMGPNYKKRLADLNAGERVEMKGKKNPTDFALWKFSPTDTQRQMERDSPRGKGFPGRHIECSAMSSKYLGESFDIHHGGSDHVTIHHTNEIAQSECCFDHKPRVKYRLHNEFLQVDGGKMSKSLGNTYSLKDIKDHGFSPLDLRYFYFKAQYTNFLNFTREALTQAKNERLGLIKKIKNLIQNQDSFSSIDSDLQNRFDQALGDNLNTPKLLTQLHIALSEPHANTLDIVKDLEEKVLKIGLFSADDSSEISVPDEILALAEQRKQAKADKNYALADQIRAELLDQGWEIKDTKDGFELIKN
ncbi:MAG: cysteine--tRNA ligase [candidate division SR1 bacterium]|nr:cysteine--tRNA ligase [candidate division SR1 bacterium]